MINSFVKIGIIMAILALLIYAFPVLYLWLTKAVEWLSNGKVGIIFISACILSAISKHFIEVTYQK
jgi:hypothetical protein